MLVVAILGMRFRLRFANRLLLASRDERKLENWRKAHPAKAERAIFLVAGISGAGILVLGSLLLTGVVPASWLLVFVWVSLFVTDFVAGVVILIWLNDLAR
jgi:hypothetical protein